MKTPGVILLLALSTLAAFAQISTFPAPPPLAPPTKPASPNADSPSTSSPSETGAETAIKNGAGTPTPGSPVTAATLTSMSALDDKVTLEAGDTVSFRVIEDRDDAVSRLVTDTGEVDFPYIGRVKVEGKTCHEVAVEVKKLLEVDYYKRATVIVGLDLIVGQDKTRAKDMAWVVGEVRSIGPQELTKAQPMTVSQLVMRAGGFADFADQRRVKVIHRSGGAASPTPAPSELANSKDYQVVDLKAVFDGISTADPVVKTGDYIIVPKRFVNF